VPLEIPFIHVGACPRIAARLAAIGTCHLQQDAHKCRGKETRCPPIVGAKVEVEASRIDRN
jgi:hypothetical protein